MSTKDSLLAGEDAIETHHDSIVLRDPNATRDDESPDSPSTVIPPTLIQTRDNLTPQQRLIIKSILTRACLGGSPHDIRMLRSYAALWTKRFESENGSTDSSQSNTVSGHAAGIAHAHSTDVSGAPRRWLPLVSSIYSASARCIAHELVHRPAPIDVRQVTYIQDEDLVLSAMDNHCTQIVGRHTRAHAQTYCHRLRLC